MTRQIVLDTETTGLETSAGHRIIEIGCVELVNRRPTRRTFHRYINPERAVDAGALEVHGIDDDFLAEQPCFRDIVDEFLEFIRDAELVIHNADFDVEFINYELRRLNGDRARAPGIRYLTEIRSCCSVLDTLALARRMHPGQRNSLDALAKRYSVDNSKRELHGALLDAQILAEVYLAMTGGQVSLLLGGQSEEAGSAAARPVVIERDGLDLTVLAATAEEQDAHAAFLARIRKKCGGVALWDRIDAVAEHVAGAAAVADGRAAAVDGRAAAADASAAAADSGGAAADSSAAAAAPTAAASTTARAAAPSAYSHSSGQSGADSEGVGEASTPPHLAPMPA
ncbi:MAG: DNA polymerase III subunit epsilon [Gammaproteobacteria bacterium]|nr:DNA polymerase III subunit epsilon [Gammaproteobacteria bacterium]